MLADLGTLHATRIRPRESTSTFESHAGGDGDGEPVSISSEDFGSVLLRFRSGARGSMIVSQASAGRKNDLRFETDAERAAFAWSQEDPERAWVGRRGEANLELVRDPAIMLPRAARLGRLPAAHGEGWFDALRNLIADFYEAVAARRDGREPDSDVATFAEGHARVGFVEAVVESHRRHQWVEVRAPQVVSA